MPTRRPHASRSSSLPWVSAIVPAHNEAGRLGRVLAVLRQVDELSEIIVVDDGSRDGTWDEIQQAAALDGRVQSQRHVTNRGKGAALFTGARAARGEVLLVLDADLINLAPRQVQALLWPVCQGQADMTSGLFCSWHLNTTLAHWVTPWLSGQRCLRRTLFLQVSEQSAAGYGVETALSLTARRQRWRCRYVFWRGVYHPPCETHRGRWLGLKTRSKMYSEIFKAWRAERGWELVGPQLRLFVAGLILTLGISWGDIRSNDLPAEPLVLANLSALPATLRLAGLAQAQGVTPRLELTPERTCRWVWRAGSPGDELWRLWSGECPLALGSRATDHQ